MGGAPPPPLGAAPQGGKKGTFFPPEDQSAAGGGGRQPTTPSGAQRDWRERATDNPGEASGGEAERAPEHRRDGQPLGTRERGGRVIDNLEAACNQPAITSDRRMPEPQRESGETGARALPKRAERRPVGTPHPSSRVSWYGLGERLPPDADPSRAQRVRADVAQPAAVRGQRPFGRGAASIKPAERSLAGGAGASGRRLARRSGAMTRRGEPVERSGSRDPPRAQPARLRRGARGSARARAPAPAAARTGTTRPWEAGRVNRSDGP